MCQLENSLESFRSLKKNWGTYGSEPPNADAIGIAKHLLKIAKEKNIIPNRIVPSAIGGIAFCWTSKKGYADIEVDNDRSIIGSVDTKERYALWRIRIPKTLDKTFVYINSLLKEGKIEVPIKKGNIHGRSTKNVM